jgi:hypothetical protein
MDAVYYSSPNVKRKQLKKIEFAVEGDPCPDLRVGSVVKFTPLFGEGGVVAYAMIDDRDGREIMVIPVDAMTVSDDNDADDVQDNKGGYNTPFTDEEELELLRGVLDMLADEPRR